MCIIIDFLEFPSGVIRFDHMTNCMSISQCNSEKGYLIFWMIVLHMISGCGLCTSCPFQSHVFLLTNTKILNLRDNLYFNLALTIAVIFRIFTLSKICIPWLVCLFGVCLEISNFFLIRQNSKNSMTFIRSRQLDLIQYSHTLGSLLS